MSRIYLSLGTNLGQRRSNLQRAIAGLEGGMTITAVSPVYETEPWGVTDQPPFLNNCVAATTPKTPRALLTFIKALETRLGRRPAARWGPRLIDIDLLFYGALILREGRLQLPHPNIAGRAFVLAPLADIAPDFVHPQIGLTVAQMLAAVDVTTVRRLAEPLLLDGRPLTADRNKTDGGTAQNGR